jgi:hypothetical protein
MSVQPKIPASFLIDGFFKATVSGNTKVMKQLLAIVDDPTIFFTTQFATAGETTIVGRESRYCDGIALLIDNVAVARLPNSAKVYRIMLLHSANPSRFIFENLILTFSGSQKRTITLAHNKNFVDVLALLEPLGYKLTPILADAMRCQIERDIRHGFIAHDENSDYLLQVLKKYYNV